MKNKAQDFKVTIEYTHVPGVEDRIFDALSMLITEEDLIKYCAKKSIKKRKTA
jgi:hypothetical protein